jgi:hypothetical protein
MKAPIFLNRFREDSVPALARLIAFKAVNELNEGNFEPIEVTELEFELICRYADYQPIRPALGTDFIRIFDELDNGKDIQITDPFRK